MVLMLLVISIKNRTIFRAKFMSKFVTKNGPVLADKGTICMTN